MDIDEAIDVLSCHLLDLSAIHHAFEYDYDRYRLMKALETAIELLRKKEV